MQRYGQDFNREIWGRSGGEGGWRGGRGGRGEGGGSGGRNRYGSDFGGMQNRGFGGGRGGQGGRFGMRQGGGEFTGGGYGGGQWGGGQQGGGFGEQEGLGHGGGMEWGGGQQRFGGMDDSNRLRAADIMTDNPETVTPDATLADAARKMRDLNVGIIPVVESEESQRLKGVITDRDIAIRAVAEGKDASKTPVSDVMTTDLETCNKNDSVRDILRVMEREQVRRVPITDREGRLVGIVAQADVAVDYLESRPSAKREVARTLRQVSEPGEPESGGTTARQRSGGRASRASQQRGEE
jgi:CBS domain-containing protein